MAIIKLNIPDNRLQALIQAFATMYHYQDLIQNPANPEVEMIPNPQSKAAFAKQKIVEHLKDIYIAGQTQTALDSARKAAILAARAEIDAVGAE